MSGIKNIFNSSSLETALELLWRTLGVRLDTDFVNCTVTAVDGSNSRLDVVARATAADGRHGIYSGTTSFPFKKVGLSSLLPTDLSFGGPYPTTFSALQQYLQSSYGLTIDDGEFTVEGLAGDPPLSGDDVIDTQDPLSYQPGFGVTLKALPSSIRWTAGSLLPLELVLEDVGQYEPLQLLGNAPNGPVGEPYLFQYVAVGGKPPYTWSIVAGTPIVPFKPDIHSLEGVVSTDEISNWTVRVDDSRGSFITFNDSAVGQLEELTFTDEMPDATVSYVYAHQFTVRGGVPPYTFAAPVGLPRHCTLSSSGYFIGVFDGGLVDVTVRCTDSRGTPITEVRRFVSNARTNLLELTSSIYNKLVSWYSCDEGNFDGGIKDQHGGRHFTSSGTIASGWGKQAGALQLAGQYAFADLAAHVLSNNMSLAMFMKTPANAGGRYLIGRASSTGGWSLRSDTDNVTHLRFDINVAGVANSVESTANFFDDQWHWAVINRDLTYVDFFDNLSEAGTGTITAGAITPQNSFGTVIGRRYDLPSNTSFTGALDNITIFSDKLWSDERAYLYNEGVGRTYTQLLEDSGNLTQVPGNVLLEILGTAPNGSQGEIFNTEYAIVGGAGGYTGLRLLAGELPVGTSFALIGNRIVLSGVTSEEGLYTFLLAINDSQNRVAVLNDTILIGNDSSRYTYWNQYDRNFDVGITMAGLRAQISSDTDFNNQQMVRSRHHVEEPSYFEFVLNTIEQDDDQGGVGCGIMDGRDVLVGWPGFTASSVGVYMPSRRVYSNGVFVGTLDGISNRICVAVNPTYRSVWIKAVDGTYLGGGTPTTGGEGLPTCTVAGPAFLCAAAGLFKNSASIDLCATPDDIEGTAPVGFFNGLRERRQTRSLLPLDGPVGSDNHNDLVVGTVWLKADFPIMVAAVDHFDGRAMRMQGNVDFLATPVDTIDLSTVGPFAMEVFFQGMQPLTPTGRLPVMQYGSGPEGVDGFSLTFQRVGGSEASLVLRNSATNSISIPAAPIYQRRHILVVRANDGYLYVCHNGNNWVGPLKDVDGLFDPRFMVSGPVSLGRTVGVDLINLDFLTSEFRIVTGSSVYYPFEPFIPPTARYTL